MHRTILPDKIAETVGKRETHTAKDNFCLWIREERIPVFYISPRYQTRYQLYVNSKMEVILGVLPGEWKNPRFWFRQLYPKDREKVI